MKLIKEKVTVTENEHDWTICYCKSGIKENHPTAFEASESIKNKAKELVKKENLSSMFIVEWITHTRVGLMVARAMTDY